jgi:DNA repair protein RAD5
MDEMESSDGPPEGFFFAGSDDGEEDVIIDTPETPASSSRASSPRTALFIPSSDDEDLAEIEDIVTPAKQKRKLSFPENESGIGVELPLRLNVKERAPIVQSMDKMPGASEPSRTSPPPKKRRISPAQHEFAPTYLGEILVPNAWSNVSGKGYVKPNESIQIKRDEQAEPKPALSKLATNQAKKKGDNKKQMSIAAMLNSKPTKATKKIKSDNIVRLFNSRGFGDIFSSLSRPQH